MAVTNKAAIRMVTDTDKTGSAAEVGDGGGGVVKDGGATDPSAMFKLTSKLIRTSVSAETTETKLRRDRKTCAA